MSYAAGALSVASVLSTTAVLTSAAATGGTGPYTYQWYRSTTSGFTPASSLAVSGATSLTLNDTGLLPSTTYYYKVVATDTGNGNALASATQLAVVTQSVQSQNAFAMSQLVGVVDLKLGDTNVVSAQVDSSSAGGLVAGQAVKMVDSSDGIPKVVETSATSDEVLGYIVYNQKDQSYKAGDKVEIAMAGTCIYLVAAAAISRGHQCQHDLTYVGGVASSVGSSGAKYVGWAYDKATAAGQVIRVILKTPSYTVF